MSPARVSGHPITPDARRATASDRDSTPRGSAHAEAAAAFGEHAQNRFDDRIEELYVFGSTIRGGARGLASDVDVLVVLLEADRASTADALRDIAYDVMLEYGPVAELHLLSAAEFKASRERGHPFVKTVIHEGRSYA